MTFTGLIWPNNLQQRFFLFLCRVPQNCFSRVHLLAYDPDGDRVKCSFVSNSTVPANISMDEVKSAVHEPNLAHSYRQKEDEKEKEKEEEEEEVEGF